METPVGGSRLRRRSTSDRTRTCGRRLNTQRASRPAAPARWRPAKIRTLAHGLDSGQAPVEKSTRRLALSTVSSIYTPPCAELFMSVVNERFLPYAHAEKELSDKA